jgi:phage tail tape-measure protein
MMNNRFAVSLIAASLLASGAAYAQSTTATGAASGAAGGAAAGPVGAVVGGTVGAAVGAGLEIPNAVITSIQGERVPSVRVRERVVVGEPLPATVQLRPVPNYTEYRYAVVNDRRVIVEPRTRKIIKIID